MPLNVQVVERAMSQLLIAGAMVGSAANGAYHNVVCICKTFVTYWTMYAYIVGQIINPQRKSLPKGGYGYKLGCILSILLSYLVQFQISRA